MGQGGGGWEVAGEGGHPWDGHWVQGPWGRNFSHCSPAPTVGLGLLLNLEVQRS